ncbi:MAG: elongation factor P [Acidimicrobiia bacterium]|nr:elongation factor P [bacterium]MXX63944.1 elongation factor P [Acidimicrobiia bacterium]MXZ07035.1 elongation factor P [Acidimicrobiia bacterium]MYD04499.1 elongation factor P [Acidimicrobiia bacterium]MYF27135.1 elongation factor P [Acidimicrobiia bacterium]
MVSTNDVKSGQALDLPDGLFLIIEKQHVKPGKGRAFVRMKLKNLLTGAVVDRTFRADEDVPQAIIDRRSHQFLYRDDLGYHFMNLETYAQFALTEEDVGEAKNYITEGATVLLPLYNDSPIGVELPASVELKVTGAEPAVRGDRVSGAAKPVTLQTGLVVQAPLFIDEGDTIKVDTRSGTYISRV